MRSRRTPDADEAAGLRHQLRVGGRDQAGEGLHAVVAPARAVWDSTSGVRLAFAAASTNVIVAWAMSTTMPRRLHSAIASFPSGVMPPRVAGSVWLSPMSSPKK